MTRSLKNRIAFYGALALTLLVLPALCYSAQWAQKDRIGNVWSVSVPKHLDPDALSKQLNGVDVEIKSIVYRKDSTFLWLVGTNSTDWNVVRDWADDLEKLPGIIWGGMIALRLSR